MATIKWRLSSRTNADGKSELYLRLTWSKDGRARAGSGIFITATKWSAEREQPKKGIDVECRQVTATMSELESQILSELVDADPQELGTEWLKLQINSGVLQFCPKNARKKTVFERSFFYLI